MVICPAIVVLTDEWMTHQNGTGLSEGLYISLNLSAVLLSVFWAYWGKSSGQREPG